MDIKPEVRDLLKKYKKTALIRSVKIPPDISSLLERYTSSYQVVAVYGGDGSIIAAIKALANSNTKLLILPGGTANIIANEHNLKQSATETLELYLKGFLIERKFDIAKAGTQLLATDMHSGWWSKAVATTPTKLKSKIGILAYGINAIKKLPSADKSSYQLVVDGKELNFESYALFIANHGYQNFLGVPLFGGGHRYGKIQIASVNSLSPLRFTTWFLGKFFLKRPIGTAIKTYQGASIKINKSPKTFLFDDQEIKIEKNLAIQGAEAEVSIFSKPAKVTRLPFYPSLLRFRGAVSRIYERMRNQFLGLPNYSYSKVVPNLYVGGQYKLEAYKLFNSWGIKAVVNMRKVGIVSPPKGFSVLQLKTRDWSPPLVEDLEKGVKFIDEHISKGEGVYVHCRLGEGRGPSMAAAFLIFKGMTAEEATTLLELRRPMVRMSRKQKLRLTEWQQICQKNAKK